MGKMFKRLLAVIVLVLIVLTCGPVGSFIGENIDNPLVVLSEAAGNFLWPVVNGSANSHKYGCKCDTHGGSHSGQDISGSPFGQAIISPIDGVVTVVNKGCKGKSNLSKGKSCSKPTCNPNNGFWTRKELVFCNNGSGNGVTVKDSSTGYTFSVGHMAYDPIVTKNQKVKKGQVLGYVGESGCSAGVHVHLSVTKNGNSINPMSLTYDKPKTTPAKSLEISGVRYPTYKKTNESFSVSGLVSSNAKITNVNIYIIDSANKSTDFGSAKPNTYYYDLNSLDSNAKFASLKAGTYTYKIVAKDANGNSLTFSKGFTVGSSATKYSFGSVSFVAPEVSVTFDGNGGTVSSSSGSFTVGNIYGDTMPSATREGYTFEGWYTAKTGGSRVNRSSTVTSGNKTLYAQWKKNETDNLKVGHVYRIYNENSGLVVAGNGSGDGAYITQRNPGEKGNGELWRVVSADANGYYKFENLACGKAMDMAADSRWAFGAQMQIMRHKEVEAQMFSVIRRKDKTGYSGLYSIHCKYNGRAVDVSGKSKNSSAQLHSWDYHGGSNQLFYFEEVTTRTVDFYDNHNNNYIASPKEVYEKYGVASPKENYNTRAADYATVTIKPEQNSIEIKALKAGQSGKDLRFDTTVNRSYDYDFSVADDSLMVLKFRAKSSVSGAKIYFRWGWDSTYKSVELTTGWKEYTVELPRTRTSGSNIHPYIDKACTIEMADIALYEKDKEGYIGDTDMHAYKSITADIYKADSCLAPEPISYKEGYAFDGWYTKRVGGVKVADAGEYYDVSALSGSQRLYAHWVEDDTPCAHTAVITDVKFATCTEQGYTTYICENCGYSYECEYVEPLGHQNKVNDPGKESTATEVGYTPGVYCDDCKTWLEGHEEIPVPVEYRYKVKEYITSDKKSVDGYTLIGSDWESEPSKTETVTYVKTWPSGSSTTKAFKTDSSLYKKYKKPSVSETETTKTVLGDEKSAKVAGYIYWHWCYTHTADGPINCKIGGYKGYKINSTYSTNNFHAFYTTSAISYNSSAKAYKKSSSSLCPYTYWWSGVKAGTEGNIQVISNKLYTYEKEYYHYKWSEWSEWSATPVEETEDVIVEMRVNAPEVKEGSCGENVTYKLSPDGTLIISGEGPMYDYSWDDETASTMPSYMTWDYDADGNIIGESKIKKVIIQNGVTSIGNYAFNACTALESVEIADTVTSIGNVAFDYCINLKNITVPSSVKRIGEEAFSESALESISLSNGLEEIGPMAFMYCKDLTSVTVPETVTSIGSYAFMLCNNLDRLVINSKDCKIGDVILLTVETDDEGCIIEDETGQAIPVECRTVIRGLEGSTAEAYADMWNQTEYPISFEEIQHYYEIDYKVAAACAQDGYSAYVCLECGEEHIDDEVDATGHKYEKVITKATLTENGEIETVCTVCGETAELTEIKSPATFELSATSYTYNGKAKTPSVTVKDSKGNTLKKDTDYTVKYESGRKNPGKYTVQITFKGNYSGTKKLYFAIAPKATSKIAATQNTSAIKLAWAKVAGASGYRIYYNSGSGWKTAVSSTTATSYTFKNLKAGAKFKFRVRAYTKDSDVIWGEYSDIFETATKPATPKLKAASTSKGKITLKWANVSGESGYEVHYSTNKDSGYKLYGKAKADATKASISKAKSGTTYYLRVRAFVKTGSGIIYGGYNTVAVKVK